MAVPNFASPLVRKVLLAAAVVIGAILALHTWLATHDSRLRMQATIEAQQQLIAAVEKRERQRGDELNQQLAQINELKRQVLSPQQIVRELPRYLSLPQPIEIRSAPVESAKKGSGQQGSGLPEKPQPAATGSVAQLPTEDLKPLFDFVQDCRACQAKLTAAQADLSDERAKIGALTRERDVAIKAAKGGSFWTRARRAAKWFIIGVGTGVALVALSHR